MHSTLPHAPHRIRAWTCAILTTLLLGSACVRQPVATPGAPPARETLPDEKRSTFTGVTSFYADSLEGRPTASGEIFTQSEKTAAHRELPFGTRLRVTEPNSGRSVVVRVNDRGPHVAGRVLDLSRSAAEELGIIDTGTARVRIEILSTPGPGGDGSP